MLKSVSSKSQVRYTILKIYDSACAKGERKIILHRNTLVKAYLVLKKYEALRFTMILVQNGADKSPHGQSTRVKPIVSCDSKDRCRILRFTIRNTRVKFLSCAILKLNPELYSSRLWLYE